MCRTLKGARVDAGYTQQTAADALNISKSSIANYETYKTVPSVETSKRIAELYGLTVDDIRWTE